MVHDWSALRFLACLIELTKKLLGGFQKRKKTLGEVILVLD
jgi:hypothetical protein